MRFAVLSAVLIGSVAFYLPGVAPRDYADGENVEIKVQNLDSVKTQLPYDFYSLGFCKPVDIEFSAENLGEVLAGSDIQNSPYEIYMQQTEACKILCKKTYEPKDIEAFAERVREQYKVNWILDNMPAGTKYYISTTDKDDVDLVQGGVSYTQRYDKGFYLGYVGGTELARNPNAKNGVPYINNHHRITISVHEDPESFAGFRIVGFEVQPFSVKHVVNGEWKETTTKLRTCTSMDQVTDAKEPQSLTEGVKEIIWTYDIQWENSDIKWASRWDLYLKMTNSHIHWFSIINSIMIVFFLSGILAMIIMRTLYRDLRRYNELDQMSEEEKEEETGWKLVHGDVFRPPRRADKLTILLGTGTQLIGMTAITLVFAGFGFLSPSNRGALMTAFLVIFVFMGFVAGYFSTRFYLMFKLQDWKANAIKTALLFPGVVFSIFFFLNLFIWGEKSTGAVPFPTLLALVALWLCIAAPLTVFGGFVASKRDVIENPVRVNNIPRVIDVNVPWYASPVVSVMVAGLLPFGAVFIELFFIMSSIWMHKFYYVFGFLALVFVIMIISCAEIAIVTCYFQLCSTDYHWWWRSFFSAGSTGFYIFLYSVYYYCSKLDISGFVPGLLFFGYMFLMSCIVTVLAGTIGFFACFWFVRKIYAAVKID